MVNDGLGDTMGRNREARLYHKDKGACRCSSEETKPEDIPDFTDDEMQKLLEIFAGKKLEDIEKEVVADMVREDLKAKAANTTVTAYKVGLSKEEHDRRCCDHEARRPGRTPGTPSVCSIPRRRRRTKPARASSTT